MAVCEIWDVRGRLDHPIDYAENPTKTANPKYTEADLQAMVDVMEYDTNKDKTEQRFFVTGVNCDPNTARDEMMIAKAQWNDMSEILFFIIGTALGSLTGVVVMCLLQINRLSKREEVENAKTKRADTFSLE